MFNKAVVASIAGSVLAFVIVLVAGVSSHLAEAAPPTTVTYWLVSGYPDAPVYTKLDSDPFVDFDRNWIVFDYPDGSRDVYYQNCKVVYYDVVGGVATRTRVEYYGDDYVETSFTFAFMEDTE